MSTDQFVLITGASGGIGLELARLFAADKFNLVLVARNQAKLNELASELTAKHGVQVRCIAQDLSQAGSVERVVQQLDGLSIEVLVNNAGVGLWGLFQDLPLQDVLNMLQLNVMSLTELTHRLLPDMIRLGRAGILNVASTAAFQPGPLMAVYYASKAYVLHFSEAIGNELRGTGVSVTALCPGPTATGFEQQAGMGDSKLFSAGRVMDAETVARIGYDGLRRGKAVVIPGFMNRLLAWATRLPPRSWLPAIARRVQERK